MKIPYDAEITECLQNVERQIYFPPVEAMPRRARVKMVIVVPPVSKREQSDKDIIPTLVRTFEPAGAEQMAD